MEARRTFAGRGQAAAPAPAAAPARGSRGGGSPSRVNFQYKPHNAATLQTLATGGDDFDKFLNVPKIWKPRDGVNTIRILPPTFENAQHWALYIKVHYGIGPDRQSYLCLHKMKGEPCPPCEERAVAQRDGDEKYAKELDSRNRALIYLIDRDDEAAGIQAYAMPSTLDRDLVKVVVDPRTQEVLPIDDPYSGYDVSFNKSGTGVKTDYSGIQVARRESPLGNDAALQYALDHPLDTVLVYFSYDRIQAEFMGGAAPAPQQQEPQARGGRQAPAPAQNDLPEVTWEYVHALASQELDALCAEMPELAEIDPATAKNDDDLKGWICEVLHLVEPAPAAAPVAGRRGAAPAPEPSGAAQRMRLTRR